MSYLEIIKKYSAAVRHVELAAFLHDVDKATVEFCSDPKYHTLENKFSKEVIDEKNNRWSKYFQGFNPDMPDCGINGAFLAKEEEYEVITTSGKLSDAFVYHHCNKPAVKGEQMYFPLTAIIVHAGGCGADGMDSAMDKADGAARSQEGKFVIATPFGRLWKFWDNFDFHSETAKLLRDNAPLRQYRELFSNILGETRIPFNDVTLWDHSFNVATFAKSLFCKVLIEYHSAERSAENCYKLPCRKGITFLKIAFDREALLQKAHISSDIWGFNEEISLLMDQVREEFENSLCIGNEIYRDHSTMLFSIPLLDEGIREKFEAELADVLETLISEAISAKKLELMPFECSVQAFEVPEEKRPDIGRQLVLHSGKLLNSAARFHHALKPLQTIAGEIHPGRVCDICSLRNAKGGRNNDDYLCPVCEKRRKEYSREGIEKLVPTDENKLAYLFIEPDLNSLRDGTLFAEAYKDYTGNAPQASPARVFRAHTRMQEFLTSFAENLGVKHQIITLSSRRLEVIVPAVAIDSIIEKFIKLRIEEFGKFSIPFKLGVIFFYKSFPLYAVIDAVSGMRSYLPEEGFDFMLLDSAAERHIFSVSGRQHHIFGNANSYTLSRFADFVKVWEYLRHLEKSQISHIENTLIAKLLEWKEQRFSETYRAFCRMVLFAPNALGSQNCCGNEDFLVEAAFSGLLLDVIDLYVHIENKK